MNDFLELSGLKFIGIGFLILAGLVGVPLIFGSVVMLLDKGGPIVYIPCIGLVLTIVIAMLFVGGRTSDSGVGSQDIYGDADQ